MLGIAIVILIVFIGSTFGWRTFRVYKASPMESTLKDHVKRLSNDIGDRSVFKYEKLQEAKDYIVGEFKGYGYEVETQGYNVYGRYSENIIVTKKGRPHPFGMPKERGKLDEVIIVGAHYDTCFNPGADDNASAVAGLLELARLFSRVETNYTLRFIAFVNEEPPFFKSKDMGSFQYVQKIGDEKIRGVIILEMLGYYSNKLFSQKYPYIFGLFYPNRANFITIVSNLESRKFAKEIKLNFKRHSRFPIESVATFSFVPGVDFSDNWSFWKAGIPAVMITDTAFYRYPYYHSEQDTYEKLDYDSLAEVVYGLYKTITSMAG